MTPPSTPTPSLILVREWEQQMSSSGCCGRLEGDFLHRRGRRCFPERRRGMEEAGALYRAVRARHDSRVQVRVVDPRNLLSLIPILVRDFRRHGTGIRTALHTLFGLSVASVVLNGRLLSTGEWPHPDDLLEHLEGV